MKQLFLLTPAAVSRTMIGLICGLKLCPLLVTFEMVTVTDLLQTTEVFAVM